MMDDGEVSSMAHEDVGAPAPFAAPAEGTVVLYGARP
jgi:hypothetical protein